MTVTVTGMGMGTGTGMGEGTLKKLSLRRHAGGGTDLLEVLILVGALLAVVSGVVVFGGTIREKFFGGSASTETIAMSVSSESSASQRGPLADHGGPSATSADDVVVLSEDQANTLGESGAPVGAEIQDPGLGVEPETIGNRATDFQRRDRVAFRSSGSEAVGAPTAGRDAPGTTTTQQRSLVGASAGVDAAQMDTDGDGIPDIRDPNPQDASIVVAGDCQQRGGEGVCSAGAIQRATTGIPSPGAIDFSGDPVTFNTDYSSVTVGLEGAAPGSLSSSLFDGARDPQRAARAAAARGEDDAPALALDALNSVLPESYTGGEVLSRDDAIALYDLVILGDRGVSIPELRDCQEEYGDNGGRFRNNQACLDRRRAAINENARWAGLSVAERLEELGLTQEEFDQAYPYLAQVTHGLSYENSDALVASGYSGGFDQSPVCRNDGGRLVSHLNGQVQRICGASGIYDLSGEEFGVALADALAAVAANPADEMASCRVALLAFNINPELCSSSSGARDAIERLNGILNGTADFQFDRAAAATATSLIATAFANNAPATTSAQDSFATISWL